MEMCLDKDTTVVTSVVQRTDVTPSWFHKNQHGTPNRKIRTDEY